MLKKKIKSLDQGWEELMAEGKKLGKAAGYQSEEEVAEFVTRERRKREPWRQNFRKTKS